MPKGVLEKARRCYCFAEKLIKIKAMAAPVYPFSPIRRVNDNVFAVETADKRIIQFKIKAGKANSETKYHLVEKALKQLQEAQKAVPLEKLKTTRFRYGDEKWKMSRGHRFTFLDKIIAFFLPFFHRQPRDRVIRINIDTAFFAPKKLQKGKSLNEINAKKLLKADQKRILGGNLAAKNFRLLGKELAALNLNPITIEEYRQGVRRKIPLQSIDLKGDEPAYTDPFTELSAADFQRYEKYYVAHDSQHPSSCDYRIVAVGKELQLIHKSSILASREGMSAAADLFLEFANKTYGVHKVDYIDHKYKLGLKTITELTPEHVYRFNIGTTNNEIQDIVLDNPPGGFQRLCSLYEKTKGLDPSLPLDTKCQSLLSVSELRGLKRVLRKNDQPVLLGDFHQWMKPLLKLSENAAEWSPEDFNKLLPVFAPELDQFDLAYTGRRIYDVLMGAYTTAGQKEYKPWIDQQELTQVFEQLKTATSWHAYQELLAHVVVKKHLARSHPTENYRVGALIPAPPLKPGMPVRWYKISSLVTNGYNYGYTLVSACNDPSLPAIKLYRSTASSPYALFSSGTLLNDWNLFNSPGYLGVGLIDHYEKPFFEKRTIPVWVGYQYAADALLQETPAKLNEAQGLLEKSNQKLLDAYARDFRTRTLREVLRENDAILNELFLSYDAVAKGVAQEKKKAKDKSPALPALLNVLVKRYIAPPEEQANAVDQNQMKKDADLLDRQLAWISVHRDAFTLSIGSAKEAVKKLNQIKSLINNLREALRKNILEPKPLAMEEDTKKFFAVLQKHKEDAKDALAAQDKKKALAYLKSWCAMIEVEAVKRNENVAGKIAQDICITGHSLGGGSAQVAYVHHITNEERMPLPGKRCSGYFFDDVAINTEDNTRFKKFGNENHELFARLKTRFEVIRRQETRDFIPRGGEEHLGATFTDAETAKVLKWLRFDAAVNERLVTSTTREIAESNTVHATRFEEGKNYRSFYKAAHVKGDDFVRTYYSPKIQGLFDSHGKRSDMDPKKAKKIHAFLNKKFWKLPSRFSLLFREEVRISFSQIMMCIRRRVFKIHSIQNQITPPLHLMDYQGNFTVRHDRGIMK